MAVFSFWMIVAVVALIGVGALIWLIVLLVRGGDKEKDDV